MRLIADIESDGLLPELKTIHSLVLRDRDSGQVVASCTDEGHKKYPKKYRTIRDGLQLLSAAEAIYMHNGIAFDIPAILKLHPEWTYTGRVLDTLVLARSRFAHQKEMDWGLARRGQIPMNMIGRHSLEAWGYRLGCNKAQYEGGWGKWSQEVQNYCEQDTLTTLALVNHIERTGIGASQAETELELAWYLAQQERNGWPFDVKKAQLLYAKMCAKRSDLEQKLIDLFGSWEVSIGDFIPKKDDAKKGYLKDFPVERFKTVQFNPGSRQHLAFCLRRFYGWKPTEQTEKGNIKVDEDTLSGLVHLDGVTDVMEFLVLEKRLGLLKKWLDAEKDGFLYGTINQSGAVTHRGTHRLIANVPRVTTKWGPELRELLYTPEIEDGDEWVQLGFDASGLELRCLAHYMARYDGGAYVKVLLEGDPHSETRNALGLDSFEKKGRDVAKRWMYAWLYGAGDRKLGLILSELLCPGGSDEQLTALGKKSRAAFLHKLPALGFVVDAVQYAAKMKGYLKLIDGRRALCREQHAALNTLLQGTGAVIFKRALVLFSRRMTEEFGPQGKLWRARIWYHDEAQVSVRKSIAARAAQIAVECVEAVTQEYSFRCPLTGEAKLGHNWAECH